MVLVALLNMDAGNIEARQNVGSGGFPPTPFGNKRWIPDVPPPFNQATQMLTVVTPIASDALSVPYAISPIPPVVPDYTGQNYRALIHRRADKLNRAGKRIDALQLLKTIGE